MHLIKLDAIDSTNDFLKHLAASQTIENYTVVTAEAQTNGRGQMGAKWETEKGKNLITSILIKNSVLDVSMLHLLNIATAVSVFDAVVHFDIPAPSIKWPNDIMAGTKKIGGILIENSIRNDGFVNSVIGIGFNVNQTVFDGLPKASSMAVLSGREFDRYQLLTAIVDNLKLNIPKLGSNADSLVEYYTKNLFKKDVPMAFSSDGKNFMAKIKGIDSEGKLVVANEDNTLKSYALKEIAMLY